MNCRQRFTVLVALCLLAVSCTRDFKANNHQFDSERWKTKDLRERGQMTDDLLTRKLLEEKSAEEVRLLLGEPDNIDYAGVMEFKTDPGAWREGANNGPWIHYLHVEFGNDDGLVRRAYITD